MLEIIPFHKPILLTEEMRSEIYNKIDNCILSGMLSNKENVRLLETEIADYYDVKYAVATSNATQGLVLVLNYLKNISNASKVYTPSFAWNSSLFAISSNNLSPEFIDIDLNTWTMQDDKYYLALPLHTFGNTCEVTSKYTLYDGAHSLGADIKDFGDATVISLAPTKIITSIEGGIILTDDKDLAEYTSILRDKFARMSEIHAIFGLAYFNHLGCIINKKREIFDYYKDNIDGIFQETCYDTNHNTIGVLTNLKIPPSIEIKKYYEPLYSSYNLLNTQKVYNKIVCLPSYYNVDYKKVVQRIKEYNNV